MAGKILIIDDEDAIRFFAGFGLGRAGWQVHEASTGEVALAWLENNPCDVVLLDLHMPGVDGLTVMREVRKHWPDIMIIIMTAYASLDSAIEAVRQGAFDYLQKPCQIDDIIACTNRAMAEKLKRDQQQHLVLQAKAVTPVDNHYTPGPASVVKSGTLAIELGSHAVFLAGERLSLTPTEYGLLEILARSVGQPISINQLIREGLGYDSGDTQAQETLRVHISRLRRKLGSKYILTVRGGGYVLANIPISSLNQV
jgi:DNA-binding response OmpR family regulator